MVPAVACRRRLGERAANDDRDADPGGLLLRGSHPLRVSQRVPVRGSLEATRRSLVCPALRRVTPWTSTPTQGLTHGLDDDKLRRSAPLELLVLHLDRCPHDLVPLPVRHVQ